MQIVTDSGVDIALPPERMAELNINVVPLMVTLDGKTYRDGMDINRSEFFHLLKSSKDLPKTSQPSPGEFAKLYKQLAVEDPEILSIHMSSGLSGTYNSAKLGASLVPEAHITHIDTKTLSGPSGWQVEAAALAAKAGWTKEKIIEMVEAIKNATETIFTLDELKYLIHGGRISHMKGLLASVLNIKPLIGVEKLNGTYVQLGFLRTFEKALSGLLELITRSHAPGSDLRVQVVHAENPSGAEKLHKLVDKAFKCSWVPTGTVSIVLSAHTGPSMVGIAYAAMPAFKNIPGLKL
jgi:DegV family protein with EDD domain